MNSPEAAIYLKLTKLFHSDSSALRYVGIPVVVLKRVVRTEKKTTVPDAADKPAPERIRMFLDEESASLNDRKSEDEGITID